MFVLYFNFSEFLFFSLFKKQVALLIFSFLKCPLIFSLLEKSQDILIFWEFPASQITISPAVQGSGFGRHINSS